MFSLYAPCKLCPWKCGVDRTQGEKGLCRASDTVQVAKALPLKGEEPPISGSRGSGTIFFSHCNLKCCFCQNYQIRQQAQGKEISTEALAALMLGLQQQGCHNINLVSASHYLPQLIKALYTAARDGLCLPIVYNTNGYEDTTVLKLLDGIVDIYLPDAKYALDTYAWKYSSARNYPRINFEAITEMFRQVGHLLTDDRGVAVKGLIVRHLILPGGLSGTESILQRLKESFGSAVFISLMGQYLPCYRASCFKELNTKITHDEYMHAVATLELLGLENGWLQELDVLDNTFVPDFTKKDSWN